MDIPADQQPLLRFKSRRNTVTLVQTDQGPAVRKEYSDAHAFGREKAVYRLLQGSTLPHARILASGDRKLLLIRLPGQVLTEVLEEQEAVGVLCPWVWTGLVHWLMEFYRETGLVMTDVNLRNFLCDSETKTLCGVDFEECAKGSLVSCAGLLAAYIRNYTPEHTPFKEQIAETVMEEFSRCLNVPMAQLRSEAEAQEFYLLHRRNMARHSKQTSEK